MSRSNSITGSDSAPQTSRSKSPVRRLGQTGSNQSECRAEIADKMLTNGSVSHLHLSLITQAVVQSYPSRATLKRSIWL
jgi:hypothetical protein